MRNEDIKVDFKDLPKHKNPCFNYCRKLIKEGTDGDLVIAFYRGEMLCLRMKLKDGAALSTFEKCSKTGCGGCGFRKYEPFEGGRS